MTTNDFPTCGDFHDPVLKVIHNLAGSNPIQEIEENVVEIINISQKIF